MVKIKVKEIIEKLKEYNPEANVDVVAHNKSYDFTLAFGGCDGGTKENCEDVSFYVDELCSNENCQD